MAPKKKGSKKAQDDWESELGETIDPIKQAEQEAKEAEAVKDEEGNGMGGGLMAALKKNRNRKKARGVVVEEDEEGVEEGDGGVVAEVDLASKAPQEATFDDAEEDVFAGPSKKGKGGKGAQKQQQVKDDDEDEEDGTGRVKTKKEKEKEKKEREKQRKKEQVCGTIFLFCDIYLLLLSLVC